jgi:RNA polymerase sigma-70 factor (ECF subfamily)
MDPRLVELAQGGDRAAFRSITDASVNRLKQVAYRILRDHDLAEDAIQQAMVDIWQSLGQLRDPARFDAWSYRFVVRACYRESKRQRRARPDIRERQAAITPDAIRVVHDRDQLDRGFQRLSLDHRAVVVMHYYLDLTMEDTADALGISVGTAKSRLHRAMSKLRTALQADSPEPLKSNGEPIR